MFYMGPIKFLFGSKFDFTAKSLVTNTVVIARVHCLAMGYVQCILFSFIHAIIAV